jgi:hypothetical protein
MQRTIDKASQAAQNADRTRRAERGQNPPRRTRTEPAPATTPSSRPHASVQCSAQRTRLRASRAYLVRSPRKYTELRSRVGEVASSSPRGPLRGRAEREQNPTRRTRPRRLAPVPSAVTPSRGSPPRQIQKPAAQNADRTRPALNRTKHYRTCSESETRADNIVLSSRVR